MKHIFHHSITRIHPSAYLLRRRPAPRDLSVSLVVNFRRHFSSKPSDRHDDNNNTNPDNVPIVEVTPSPTTTTVVNATNGGGGPEATTTVDGKPIPPAIESLLKAPYQKVSQPGLFPWRHEEEPLPRLIPGTPDYETKGFLLGGNILSSSPNMDALATEYLFLKVPWYNLLFFRRAWEADLVESMQWAFFQAVPAMLSNTFTVPFDKLVSSGDDTVEFSHESKRLVDDIPNGEQDKEEVQKQERPTGVTSQKAVERMVHPDLLQLYHTAREFGTESLRVRLEMKSTNEPPVLVNLFAFPFLSRSNHKKRKKKYNLLLDSIAESGGISSGGLSPDAMETVHGFMEEFSQTGKMESTVLCQVLIPCDEIFCVKDAETGRLIQGHADEKFRRVVHLVRFEQTVTAHWTNKGGIFPFRIEPGEWQITDIDDLLEGNLLL
ncbi:hypothetical protein IV203_008194 [Nitzschia inconspicua]|uniref:Uncharacterized protein n=1 Tax=Nitzschia inconspicua TaxID=303405 RepID=A0A9K3KYR9_9STRA|nr:hypothetical protein IV203_011081 [Nitzschia inconspicua]KAG7352146.1 hypothetical protein IV203_008194 [Nitzschia inconspicua]